MGSDCVRHGLRNFDERACPWLNQSLSIHQRVQLLLAQMTLSDKINMVTGAGFGTTYVFEISGIPSLCIPAIGEEDGPLGVGDGLTGVTQMPSAVSLAATFDPSLARKYGAVVGSEERAKGAMVDLGPTVNIDRDPRWGRSFEAYTEDPFLNAAMAVGDIDGVQSQDEMAQVKHLAVYNQETNRNTPADDAIVSDRALHEIYLPAFWAGTVQAKASSVMCAYSTINGEAACQNDYLMKTTLDDEWGFPGFVTSDYQATHSTVQSADAGMDQEMPAAQYYGPALQAAVQDGQVSMGTLDDMVSRILTEMFRFNEFNNPPTGSTTATVTTPANQAVSTTVAEAGTVLLEEQAQHPAGARQGRRDDRRDRAGRVGHAHRHRRRQRVRDLDVQCRSAAGDPGGRRAGDDGQLLPGPSRRHLAYADTQRRLDPGLRLHRIRRHLHRNAHGSRDRDLRARVPESGQLHGHQPVPEWPGDSR